MTEWGFTVDLFRFLAQDERLFEDICEGVGLLGLVLGRGGVAGSGAGDVQGAGIGQVFDGGVFVVIKGDAGSGGGVFDVDDRVLLCNGNRFESPEAEQKLITSPVKRRGQVIDGGNVVGEAEKAVDFAGFVGRRVGESDAGCEGLIFGGGEFPDVEALVGELIVKVDGFGHLLESAGDEIVEKCSGFGVVGEVAQVGEGGEHGLENVFGDVVFCDVDELAEVQKEIVAGGFFVGVAGLVTGVDDGDQAGHEGLGQDVVGVFVVSGSGGAFDFLGRGNLKFFARPKGDDHAEVFGFALLCAGLRCGFVGAGGFAAFFVFFVAAAGAGVVSADFGHFCALLRGRLAGECWACGKRRFSGGSIGGVGGVRQLELLLGRAVTTSSAALQESWSATTSELSWNFNVVSAWVSLPD